MTLVCGDIPESAFAQITADTPTPTPTRCTREEQQLSRQATTMMMDQDINPDGVDGIPDDDVMPPQFYGKKLQGKNATVSFDPLETDSEIRDLVVTQVGVGW